MSQDQPAPSVEGLKSPSPPPLHPTAGEAVYANDLIINEVMFWLYAERVNPRYQGDLKTLMLLDHRGFVRGAGWIYNDISYNLLERLSRVDCGFSHLQLYLQAVKTFTFPVKDKKMPMDIDTSVLRSQYPLLKHIRFILPHCRAYSTMKFYDTVSSELVELSGGDRKASGDGIIGHLELAMDSNKARQRNIYDKKMGVHGAGARFHLTGLVLGNCYYQENNIFSPGETYWNIALAPLLWPLRNPGQAESEDRWKHAEKDCWPTLLRHLKALAICTGGTVEQLAALANSAPGLTRLSIHFKSVYDKPEPAIESEPEWSSDERDEQEIFDGPATVDSFLKLYKVPANGLHFIALTVAGANGFPELAGIASRNTAAECQWNWAMAEMAPLEAGTTSLAEWRKGLKQRVSWQTGLDSLYLTPQPDAEETNTLTVAIMLNSLLRPSLPVYFVPADRWRELDAWCKNVRETRLYLIEQDRKYQPRGYRLLQGDDVGEDPKVGQQSTAAISQSVASPVQAVVESWEALSEVEKAEFAARTCFRI